MSKKRFWLVREGEDRALLVQEAKRQGAGTIISGKTIHQVTGIVEDCETRKQLSVYAGDTLEPVDDADGT